MHRFEKRIRNEGILFLHRCLSYKGYVCNLDTLPTCYQEQIGELAGLLSLLGLIRIYFFFLNRAIYAPPISVSGVQFGKNSSCKNAVL